MARRSTGARSARRRATQPAAASAVAASAVAAVTATTPAAAVSTPVPTPAVPSGLRLEGALQIREVQQHKAQLCAALDADAPRIDLDGITAVDTAGIQLLLAVAQEAARRQRSLRLRGCPPAVLEAVRSLGLDAALEPLMVESA